jgi:hypothetical protein
VAGPARYLYGRVAHAADCATLRVPGYQRPLCPSSATAAALGVDGLATDPASAVFSYQPPAGISRGAATARFDEAVLSQQPLRVAADIAGDAIKAFALTRDTAEGDPPVARWQFQRHYPVYRAAVSAVLGTAAKTSATEPLAGALRRTSCTEDSRRGLCCWPSCSSERTVASPAAIRLWRRAASLPPGWPWRRWQGPTCTSSPGATSFPRSSRCRWPASSAEALLSRSVAGPA